MGITFGNDKNKALALARATAQKAATTSQNAIIKYVSPKEARNKMALVPDDSGSMSGHVENVREAMIEFLRSCKPNEDAICIHTLCARNPELEKLQTDLPKLAGAIKSMRFGLGSTPLFGTMKRVLTELDPAINRMIVFTDGSPTDNLDHSPVPMGSQPSTALTIYHERDANIIITLALEQKILIDTIFFGSEEWGGEAITLLKYLAEKTGGIFMIFDPQKVDFRKSLKYLAPTNRLMLTAGKVKDIQDGRI